MKKFKNYSTKEDSIISTRNIPSEEWNEFYERMENVIFETHHKLAESYRSSLDVFVK